MIIEWMKQKVRTGKWDDLEKFEKKFVPIENKLGFPPKRRLRGIIGPTYETLIIQRQWESLAQWEECWSKAFSDPNYNALGKEVDEYIESSQIEIYYVLP